MAAVAAVYERRYRFLFRPESELPSEISFHFLSRLIFHSREKSTLRVIEWTEESESEDEQQTDGRRLIHNAV